MLWYSGLSARAPESQKLKNGGIDQYGAEPFEQQQLGTAGVKGVKYNHFNIFQLELSQKPFTQKNFLYLEIIKSIQCPCNND